MTADPSFSFSCHAGDLFELTADAIVNPWNRNFVPRALLTPRGVSGRLKALTGPAPWRELASAGFLPLGGSVITSSGHWDNVEAIIHVAGLTMRWTATAESVAASARGAVLCAARHGARTLLMPLIGSGTGGLTQIQSETAILAGLSSFPSGDAAMVHVIIVALP